MNGYLSSSPLIKTLDDGSTGFANVTIVRALEMTGNQIDQSEVVFSGKIFCPSGYEDFDFQPIIKDLLGRQKEIKTQLLYFGHTGLVFSGNDEILLNSYFTISDGATSDDYSVLYSTKNLNYEEAGLDVSTAGFIANRYLETAYLYEGQYFDLTYQTTTNVGDSTNMGRVAMEYRYHSDQAMIVGYHDLSEKNIYDQSFKISGMLETEAMTGHPVEDIRFGFYDQGMSSFQPITGRWKIRRCTPRNLAILYYVDSLGGISWLYDESGAFTETKVTDRNYYQRYATIDRRQDFGKTSYFTKMSSKYVFNTKLVKSSFSEEFADVLNSDYMWLYLPEKTPQLRSVLITDTQLKVKNRAADKIYNYTYNLEDSQYLIK